MSIPTLTILHYLTLPDTSLSPLLPPIQPHKPRHTRIPLSLPPLLPPLLFSTRARDPPPPRPRRRSRQRKPHKQNRRTRHGPLRAPPPNRNQLPPNLPPNPRIPRYRRPMHPQNRTALLAHPLHLPPPTKRSLRASPPPGFTQNSRRLPSRSTSLRRRRTRSRRPY